VGARPQFTGRACRRSPDGPCDAPAGYKFGGTAKMLLVKTRKVALANANVFSSHSTHSLYIQKF
jgi:hypothetical protein